MQLAQAKAALQAHTAEVLEYESEVIKIIRGESKLSQELLTKLHEEAKARAEDAARVVENLQAKIQDGEQLKSSMAQQYETMRSWADMYDQCDIETKKMILSRIMTSVRVRRNYEIEIDLSIDREQLGIANPGSVQADDADDTPKKAASY